MLAINWYNKIPFAISAVLGAAIILCAYLEPTEVIVAEINLRSALVPQVPATLAGLSLAVVILILSNLLPSTLTTMTDANKFGAMAKDFEEFDIEGAKDLAKLTRQLASDVHRRSQSEADRLRDAAAFLLNSVYAFLLSLAIILALDTSQNCVAQQCASIGVLLRTLPLAGGFLYLLLGTRAIADYSILGR